MNLNLPRLGLFLTLGLLLCGALRAADKPAKDGSWFPDADTRVLRELSPSPLLIHVFKPEGWKAAERRPALIFFFGGGWNRGTPDRSAGWARWAAKLGMVGIAPDYRTRDRHGTDPLACVADARLALRWVQEHAAELGIDASRIAVGGSSAGGHLALWTAIAHTPPGSSEAERPLAPPAALLLLSPVSDTSLADGYAAVRFGANADALSAVHQLDEKMPPVLVFHGDADTTVPHRQSAELTRRLKATGNRCELVTVPHGSHGFSSQLPEWKLKSQQLAQAFLRRELHFEAPGLAPEAHVPATAPRTGILAGQQSEFRDWCLHGEGAAAFSRIKADLDKHYLAMKFAGEPPPQTGSPGLPETRGLGTGPGDSLILPAQPLTYGDPSPSRRTSRLADAWRDLQALCNRAAGTAEACTLCWLVTGEAKYLDKAKELVLGLCTWSFDPDWRKGPSPGATDIAYNDEAHFRLWRKLPLVYDQLRDHFSPEEKARILAHFRERGRRSAEWIERQGSISAIRPNSIEAELSSHPVRFMPMTGLAGLALWDDLPEARQWWATAYRFYAEQFSPWGGDDGGWAEGPAYWRGTFEHAAFQDLLASIGDPRAYSGAFWRNSPYFAVYNVQPYEHTIFGDTSSSGHFRLEQGTADYLRHVSRQFGDGRLAAFANLCADSRAAQAAMRLAPLDSSYPIATEFLLRAFEDRKRPLPAPVSLAGLPSSRFFQDIGWVSLHSALGQPAEDIQITFKSSPYGSFSHSHADQNAFILNAYGESLAINSAYREFHNSPHHKAWTRRTLSKNALLIDGEGQLPQSKESVGRITQFMEAPRWTWVTGDATTAYALMQPGKAIRRVTRDLVFIDHRYVVLRDRVELDKEATLSWLLHAEKNLQWKDQGGLGLIRAPKAQLLFRVLSPGHDLKGSVTTVFPEPVDPKYRTAGRYTDQAHLRVDLVGKAKAFEVYSVLWPEKGGETARLEAPELRGGGKLLVRRPDGKTDLLAIETNTVTLE